MQELDVVCEQIECAQHPEDIFGVESDKVLVKNIFRQLSKVVHPDRVASRIHNRIIYKIIVREFLKEFDRKYCKRKVFKKYFVVKNNFYVINKDMS